MVFVEGGEFLMGSNWNPSCSPEHKEKVSSFYIGKYEITQEQWLEVMGELPKSSGGNINSKSSETSCKNCPVEGITYENAISFLEKLNFLTGKKYRLPTESEWEFAAIGGNKSKGYFFSGGNNSEKIGWTIKNSDNQTHPIGTKIPNELGIFDLNGNVTELTTSRWVSDYTNPIDDSKLFHIVRGGGCNDLFHNKINWLKIRITFSYTIPDNSKQSSVQTYPTYIPVSPVGIRLVSESN